MCGRSTHWLVPPMRKIICLVAVAAALLTPASASQPEVVCELPVLVPSLSAEYPGSDVSCLGCIVADAVRGASGAEVALVNSGDLAGDLSQKTVTREDVRNVFREDRPLAVAELSAEELAQVLEHALSCIVVDSETERIDRAESDFDGFAQVSGIKVKYDASARAGERIYALELEDGTKLDPERDEITLTVAATAHMWEGGYGYPVVADYERLDTGLVGALEQWLSPECVYVDTDRIVALGTADNVIINVLPREILVLLLIAAIILIGSLRRKHRRYRRWTKPMKRGEASRYLTD